MESPTTRHYWKGESKLEVSIRFFPSENPYKIVRKDQKTEGMEDTKKTGPTESIKQGSQGFTETEVANMEPAMVCTRSSMYVMAISLGFFLDS